MTRGWLRPERRRSWGCVCVRGPRGAVRRWRRRPRSLARSAARGPPGRAHCSRPVSTGLARRREPFPWNASAPPSAYGCRGPHGRLRSDTRTSPRASPRDREVLAVGAGAGRLGSTTLLPSVPGIGVGRGPFPGPTFLESRSLLRSICCCLGEPRAHPRGGVGGGGGSVCSGSFAF